MQYYIEIYYSIGEKQITYDKLDKKWEEANWLRINPTHSETLVPMDPDKVLNLNQSEHQTRFKTFFDWFAMIRKVSKTDFGMDRIHSD